MSPLPSLSHTATARTTSAFLLPLVLLTQACGATQVQPTVPIAGSEARPPSPSPDAVWVRFEPEEKTQHWSVIGADEKVICEIPCSHWISAQTGALLQDDIPGTIASIRVPLPNDLGAPGTSVVAVARRGEPTRGTGTRLLIGGLSVAILGAILYFALNNVPDSALAFIGGGAVIGATMAGFGIYFRVKSHPPDVALHAARAPSPVTFAVGTTPANAPGDVTVRLTPFGVSGTF